MREDLVLPRLFLARFRSSPTTESLEQAKMDRTVKAPARADLVKILPAGARKGCQITGG